MWLSRTAPSNIPSGNDLVTVTAFTKGKDYSQNNPQIENIAATTSFSAMEGKPTVTLLDFGGEIVIKVENATNYVVDADCPIGYNVPSGSTLEITTLGGNLSLEQVSGSKVVDEICTELYDVSYTGSGGDIFVSVTLPTGTIVTESINIPYKMVVNFFESYIIHHLI